MICYGYVNPWAFVDDRTGDCKNCPAGHGWRGHIEWPTKSHAIHPGRGFQYGHPAIDIDTPIGSPVYAAETGVVIWAGWCHYGYGNLIILDHGRKYQTFYAHLEDVEITCNSTVMRGQHIGNVGMTGQSSFEHVHFEVRENRLSCNPLIWLEGTVPPPDNGEEEKMIQNPSFEGVTRPGGWTRDTYIGTEFGEIYVPEGWTAWWQEGAFRRPEMRVIQRIAPFNDPPRIQEGNWAFQSFTMFGRQHAGLYQVVKGLTPGRTYKLSGKAHAWSLHPGIGEQSAYCSSGVGCGAVYIDEENIPPLNNDPENDAIGNFVFRVGTSFGEPSPLGEVSWGAGACIYNVYHEVPPLRFIAPADGKVTIYLCATSLWEFKNSDAYWDAVKLEEVEGPPDPPPDDRGKPRIQYERTYVLMHPEADERWVEAVIRATWNNHRYTIGGSADDAGIGDLDVRNIIAINPDGWPGDLEAFYRKYYPGVNYTSIEAATPDELQEKLSGPFDPPSGLLVWQCNPKWKDEKVASPSCSKSLCQTGCWISASAMTQRFFDIKPDATPATANQTLGAANGFSGCATRWSGMKALGLEVVKKIYNESEVRQWLDTGNVCFAEVEPETYMHFILVTKYQEGRFWMHDPYKNVEGWVDEYYPGIESWRLIRPFEPVPPPPHTPINLINPHMQTAEAGVFAAQRVAGRSPLMQKILSLYYTRRYNRDQAAARRAAFSYLRDANSNSCKVFSFEDVYGVLRANPNTIAVVRHCTNDYGGIFIDDAELGARRWVNLFRDALYATCTYIDQHFPNIKKPYFYMEAPNELYPSHNAPLVTRAANLDQAIAYEIQRTGLPIATVGYCAGVGNPHETEFELLVPLARTLEETGGAMGLHLYWWANENESGLESWWKYHAGRYQEVDKVLVAAGVHVDWLCGESGVVQSDDGYHLNAHSGWRDVMSWARYLADLLTVNRWDNEWNKTHENRFKSRDVFTTCAHFCNWFPFRVGQPEWEAIAARME